MEDAHSVPHQRLGLREVVGVLEQLRQIIEIDGDIRVVLATGGADDLQGAAGYFLRPLVHARRIERVILLSRSSSNVFGRAPYEAKLISCLAFSIQWHSRITLQLHPQKSGINMH